MGFWLIGYGYIESLLCVNVRLYLSDVAMWEEVWASGMARMMGRLRIDEKSRLVSSNTLCCYGTCCKRKVKNESSSSFIVGLFD